MQKREYLTAICDGIAVIEASVALFRAQPVVAQAKILSDPFLSDNPSRDNGRRGYLTGKNSTQGGDR